MSPGTPARDVVAVTSQISAIVDDTLTYRGIPIEDLFEYSTFEEVVFLLWFGQLPTRSDLDAFRARLRTADPLNADVEAFLRRAASGGVTRSLEAGVIGLGLQPPVTSDAIAVPLQLLTGLPAIVATYGRQRPGNESTLFKPGDSIAAGFLSAWNGRTPSPDEARAFDRALILVADHELNASTFAARVAASTGADLVSTVLAAIATQSGPLHGGALCGAGDLLQRALQSDPATEIEQLLAAGERIPGFGHSVYRQGDPRAALFRALSVETADRTADRKWLEIADRIAEIGTERTNLLPNLDLYAAAYWSALGIPTELFPAIFAIGRVAGWIAHYREQIADNRLIRPRARYTGRIGARYIPIDERGEWFTRAGA